jgi:hypothetical protein
MRLMIASKFWSRSTYLKPYPRLIGHVIGDSVLYHTLMNTAGDGINELIIAPRPPAGAAIRADAKSRATLP